MSHLVPDVRVNKNGVAVTKHVRPDGPAASNEALRAVPVPPVAAPAPPAGESPEERFDRVRNANSDFVYDRSPREIDDDGRQAMADLIYAAADTTDDEGKQRVGIATYVIRSADVLGARSMMLHKRHPKRQHSEGGSRYPFTVLDVWDRGTEAGVIERNRLYTPGEPESSLYGFLIDFFIAAEDEDYPEFFITEASEDDLRELAIVHERKPDADPAQMVAFFEDRGEIAAELYLDAFAGAPSVASGVL